MVLFFLTVFPVWALSPNDPAFSNQWYLQQIHAPEAWDETTGSSDVIVAVIDTGIDLNHPDLQDNIWKNTKEVPEDNIDNDNNGYVDDVYGWDYLAKNGNPDALKTFPYDEASVSHGTVVAGMIAAVGNNAKSIAGINWKTKIMSLRILDELGSGDSTYGAQAVYYAVQNKADIINLSFTGVEVDPKFLEAIQYAHEQGVLVVAAVGNEGMDVNVNPIYPVCFSGEEDWVLGVAATEYQDKKATFSNYGSDCVDISAPGVDIYGLLYEDQQEPDFSFVDGGYWQGTSMAAPMISAAAALLLGRFPALTVREVELILQLSADPIQEKGTKAQGQLGAGRVNIQKALETALSFAQPRQEKVSASFFAASQATGAPPQVRLFDTKGTFLSSFDAYDAAFTGGVRLAVGDVDGDEQEEIVTVPGRGGGPQVRIFRKDGSLVNQFFAFPTSLHSGLFVATADINQDGKEEIIITPDEGGTGRLKIFQANGELLEDFFPFDPNEKSVRVAAGDVNQDGEVEIIASLGKGNAPLVRVFTKTGIKISEFLAYASTYDRGVFVDSADVDGDGIAEIITGTDAGGGPQIRIFGVSGEVKSSFFAFDEQFRGGVSISAADTDADGKAEIYASAGAGGGPHIRVFTNTGKVIGSFFAFDESLRNGVHLAIW